MADLPDQTDPEFDSALVDQVAEALYARDREPDHMDPEYDWANIDTGYDWSDEDQSPTDDYRAAARIALGAVTSVLGISSLVARLAQAEAAIDDLEKCNESIPELQAALATARRDALNEAADAIPTDPWARWATVQPEYSDGSGRVTYPVAEWLRARAALVVADTGEGLSKTSAKPLVVADTPTAKAHQEGEADS